MQQQAKEAEKFLHDIVINPQKIVELFNKDSATVQHLLNNIYTTKKFNIYNLVFNQILNNQEMYPVYKKILDILVTFGFSIYQHKGNKQNAVISLLLNNKIQDLPKNLVCTLVEIICDASHTKNSSQFYPQIQITREKLLRDIAGINEYLPQIGILLAQNLETYTPIFLHEIMSTKTDVNEFFFALQELQLEPTILQTHLNKNNYKNPRTSANIFINEYLLQTSQYEKLIFLQGLNINIQNGLGCRTELSKHICNHINNPDCFSKIEKIMLNFPQKERVDILSNVVYISEYKQLTKLGYLLYEKNKPFFFQCIEYKNHPIQELSGIATIIQSDLIENPTQFKEILHLIKQKFLNLTQLTQKLTKEEEDFLYSFIHYFLKKIPPNHKSIDCEEIISTIEQILESFPIAVDYLLNINNYKTILTEEPLLIQYLINKTECLKKGNLLETAELVLNKLEKLFYLEFDKIKNDYKKCNGQIESICYIYNKIKNSNQLTEKILLSLLQIGLTTGNKNIIDLISNENIQVLNKNINQYIDIDFTAPTQINTNENQNIYFHWQSSKNLCAFYLRLAQNDFKFSVEQFIHIFTYVNNDTQLQKIIDTNTVFFTRFFKDPLLWTTLTPNKKSFFIKYSAQIPIKDRINILNTLVLLNDSKPDALSLAIEHLLLDNNENTYIKTNPNNTYNNILHNAILTNSYKSANTILETVPDLSFTQNEHNQIPIEIISKQIYAKINNKIALFSDELNTCKTLLSIGFPTYFHSFIDMDIYFNDSYGIGKKQPELSTLYFKAKLETITKTKTAIQQPKKNKL